MSFIKCHWLDWAQKSPSYKLLPQGHGEVFGGSVRALHAGLQQPVAEHVSISYTVHATDKARVKHPHPPHPQEISIN